MNESYTAPSRKGKKLLGAHLPEKYANALADLKHKKGGNKETLVKKAFDLLFQHYGINPDDKKYQPKEKPP